MRFNNRIAVVALGAIALVILTAAAGACGGGTGGKAASPSPQWEQVLTADLSGAQPVKLNLGNLTLGGAVRLGWELSGPERPPVALTFRIINVENGVGYGNSVTPADPGFAAQNDEAITLAPIWPGKYVVFFSQRFPPAKGPGYDGKLTISTLR